MLKAFPGDEDTLLFENEFSDTQEILSKYLSPLLVRGICIKKQMFLPRSLISLPGSVNSSGICLLLTIDCYEQEELIFKTAL